MNFDINYKIGDSVLIKSTNIVGMIISISIRVCDTGYSATYEIAYPDVNGYPDAKTFFEVELEKADKSTFGFKK